MSNYRVIAAVTATLQNLLQDAVSNISGSQVRTARPERDPGHEVRDGAINIYLYQVQPNPTWRNHELPLRRSDGTLIERPCLALDLHYLLSFYGDDSRKIPHLLLGQALAALHAEPTPSPIYIPRPQPPSDIDPNLDLGRSGLRQESHLLIFTPLSMSHDELSKLWSIFFQVPYSLSVAYRCSVVLLEPELVPQPALPVRTPQGTSVLPRVPLLESITPTVLEYRPDARLTLIGRQLKAKEVVVRFGELEAAPQSVNDTQLVVALPAAIRVGMNRVQVIHGQELAHAASPHWIYASDPVAFVLQPRIVSPPEVSEESSRPSNSDPTSASSRSGERAVWVKLKIAPKVAPEQRAQLLLNRLRSDPASPPRSFAVPAEERLQLTDALEFRVPLPSAKARPETFAEPGDYLLRVEIDGIASRLEVDSDPESPTYQRFRGPRAQISGP